jgi:hypothetical protein
MLCDSAHHECVEQGTTDDWSWRCGIAGAWYTEQRAILSVARC